MGWVVRWSVTSRYIAARIARGYRVHTVFTGMLGHLGHHETSEVDE
jgi:hypothetical protein